MKRIFATLLTVSTFCLLTACATKIHPTVEHNPPPAEPLKSFGKFTLKPAVLASKKSHEKGSAEKALIKIQDNMDLRAGKLFEQWNALESGDRELIVTPVVEDLKFVSGGKRFLAGGLAGSSAVRMVVTLEDAETGKLIARPEFYQRAAAIGGAYTMGGTDNNMLIRINSVFRDYLENNYVEAVGGPTGARTE